MFKTELIEYIKQDYKELNELEVSVDGDELVGNLYNLLTPYLAHKNTIDDNNRLISFYTKEGSKQQKLLPFYIGLSNYYKTFSDLSSSVSDEDLETTALVQVLEEIIEILPAQFQYLNKKWDTKELTFDIKRNNRIHLYIQSVERLPQLIAPKIQDILSSLKKEIHEDFNLLESKIEEVQKSLDIFLEENESALKFLKLKDNTSSKIGINEILALGKDVNEISLSGVLLFTSKAKYRKLIEDTFFNGSSVSSYFPISEIIISDSGFKTKSISSESKPVIYYCSAEYFCGWEEIITEIGADYINTIVLDDFDLILKKESRNNYQGLEQFSKSILQAQKENRIKDVYFLESDINFDKNIELKKAGIETYPWLLNNSERTSLSKGYVSRDSTHKLHAIKDNIGAYYWTNFKPIILQLSGLIKNEYILEKKVELLCLLSSGYSLLHRANSFHEPVDFTKEFNHYVSGLESNIELSNLASFRNKLSQFKDLFSHSTSYNSKLEKVRNIIKELNLTGKVAVVSKNLNENDITYGQQLISTGNDDVPIFLSLEHLSDERLSEFDAIFCLNYSEELLKKLLLHKFSKYQFLILNDKQEYWHYCNRFKFLTGVITNLSDFDNKLLLLNLEDKEHLIEQNKLQFNIEDYVTLQEIPKKIEIRQTVEDELNKIEEQDFSFIIEELLSNEKDVSKDGSHSSNLNTVQYLILFEDSFIKVSKSKSFHLFIDDNEGAEDIKVKSGDLKVGDKIFMMHGFNDDFNELLLYLKSIYKKLDEHYDKANSWRLDLINQYEELGGYTTRLKRYLAEKGIIVTPPTIERWLSGLTMFPDSLPEIITLFQIDSSSLSSKYSKDEILISSDWLSKFRTSLHKEIYKYYVFKKYNMNHQIEQLKLKNLIERLEKLVEIKEILMITKY